MAALRCAVFCAHCDQLISPLQPLFDDGLFFCSEECMADYELDHGTYWAEPLEEDHA